HAPGIEWQKSFFAPTHPGFTDPANTPPAGPQTKNKSGEDWFYDVKLAKNLSTPTAYVCAGYSTFVNSETINECYSYTINDYGPFDSEEFENDNWLKGNPRPKMALVDLKGNLIWYKLFGVASNGNVGSAERFYNIIQTSDDGFLAIGRRRIGGEIPYNQSDANPNGKSFSCTAKVNGIKEYVVKTDYAGNLLWQGTYGFSETSDLDNYASVGYDVVETANEYIICGRAADVNNVDTRAVIIKVNKSNGRVISKAFVGNTGKDSWIRAVALEPNTTNLYVTGKEPGSSNVGYYDLFVQKIDLNDYSIDASYYVNVGSTTNNIGYDIAYDAINGRVIVAGTMDVEIAFAENSQGSGEGHVYILNPTNLSLIGNKFLGAIKAYDLQIGLASLSDGSFIVTVPKQNALLTNIPNQLCGGNFDDVETTPLWNTDVYVEKFSGVNPYQSIWNKTFDYDVPQAL
ncbi:MAG: hypothetical protein LH473_10295, partial [Chitinophagales bacterium]|nr:hypothetical protein [Chitinophagales bacterium]